MNATIVELDRAGLLTLERGDVIEHCGLLPVVEDAYRIDTAAARRWFAIQTNPKCEDRASDRLERSGFGIYAPRRRMWGKRDRRTNKMPRLIRHLFPGYLFVSIPECGAFDEVRKCDGVRRIIDNHGAPEPMPDKWVTILRDRESAGEFDETRRRKGLAADGPFPDWIVPGAIVRIVVGPFAQFLAQIVDAVQEGRIRAEIRIFGRASVVDLDVAQVAQM